MPVPKWEKAIKCCSPRLEKEIVGYPGTFLLAYGGHALRALTKKPTLLGTKSSPGWMGFPLPITAFRKSPIISEKMVLPALHPAFGFRKPQYKEVTAIHTHRALLFEAGKMKPWDWQNFLPPDTSEDRLVDELARLAGAGVVGFDTETRGLDFRAELTEVSLADRDVRLVIHWPTATPRVKEAVAKVVSSEGLKVMHNAPYDLMVAWHNGLGISGPLWDTLLAARLLRPGVAAGLDTLAVIEFAVERWKSIFKTGGGAEDDPEAWSSDVRAAERGEYASKDAAILIPLRERQAAKLVHADLKRARFDALMEDLPLAAKMRMVGIAIDEAQFEHLKGDLNVRLLEARGRLETFAHEMGIVGFKPGAASPIKLFKALGVESGKKTDKGTESFNATVVGELLEHRDSAVRQAATLYLTFKKLAQYVNTQVNNLEVLGGVVHPDWDPNGAKTSRWSVSKPNVNQLAKPKEFKKGDLEIELPNMKRMFRARPGRKLVAADWKQAEARVAAVVQGDIPSVEAFKRGDDIHTVNAIALSGGPIVWDRMTPGERKDAREIAKTYLFGRILYGGSIATVWGQAVRRVPTLKAEALSAAELVYFRYHPAIKQWRESQLARCKTQGFVACPFDPSIRLVFKEELEGNWHTQSLNFPIQSSVAWWMRKTMHRVSRRLDWAGGEAILAQVYDALLLEGPDAERLADVLREEMLKSWTLGGQEIPMDIDIEVGENWGEMEKLRA
jgi:DNA polymerase I-like protein with 3'-5' exonuclease and polymerase domains